MSTRDPETILAAWLDEGPTDLPDATRRAILTAIPTTQQTRRGRFAPWRLFEMNPTARIVAAAAVLVVAVVGAAYLFTPRSNVGGPPPTPSPAPTVQASPSPAPVAAPSTAAPSPTPLDPTTWVPFTSPRNGASAKFPADWPVTAAKTPWIWQFPDPGPPPSAVDAAVSSDRMAFNIASQRIPTGMSYAAWRADYVEGVHKPLGCGPGDPVNPKAVTVGGHVGFQYGGLAQCNFTEVIVLFGGRAYQLTGYVNIDSPAGKVFDPPLFNAWLATIHLDPASASDAPA